MKYSDDPQLDPEELELQAEGEDLGALVRALPLDGVRSVLDVGCGPGTLARAIARTIGEDSVVWGIDTSESQIAHARDAARRAGIENARFAVGDVTGAGASAIEPGRFDLVFCKYVMMYLIPSGRAIPAIRRMTAWARPGGRVACYEPDVDFGRDRFPPAPHPLADVLPRVVDHYRDAGLIEWRSGMQLYSLLLATGLEDIEVGIVYDRRILGGRPRALVEHDGLNIEELLNFVRRDVGGEATWRTALVQWREYLAGEGNFISTPIYLGIGRRP